MDVKEETTKATSNGTTGLVSTPLTGNSTVGPPYNRGLGKSSCSINTIFDKLMPL
jgi:hypothetical protein